MGTTQNIKVESVDMKLEVVVLGVSDVDLAKAFYEKIGWRLDADIKKGDEFRAIQITPHNSQASVIFGNGITPVKPDSGYPLILAVDDLNVARNELIERGVTVSEIFHFAGGPFNNTLENPRINGFHPQSLPYHSFASFEDPDGNGWLLQEIKMRLPGREWETKKVKDLDIPSLAELLRETSEKHDRFEKTHGEHHWWDWYAAYMNSRQSDKKPEDSEAAADKYMENNLNILNK